MKPVVFIGQKGLTPAIRLSTEKALDQSCAVLAIFG